MYVESGYIDTGYFGQPGSLCAFILGSETLLFDQPPARPARTHKLIQATAQSSGGDIYGYPVYATDRMLILRWPRLQSWYLDRLRDWIADVARGMANSFTYRDLSGNLQTVRLGNSKIKEREITPDRHAVEIVLWIES